MSTEEQELIRRLQLGDDRFAFEALVRLHQQSVRAFLARLCGQDQAWADDLAQDTFLTAHHHRLRFTHRSSYKTWLLGIARNLYRNSARREKLRTRNTELPQDLAAPEARSREDLNEELSRAITMLTADQQQVLHLVYLEQLPLADAAEIMQIPLNTAKSHLARAKTRLRELLPS
ncbi:MAG: RNA polymerase sigma factor [Opitutaceae bacterium]|nr:RNA polymerase sigma factor [Opitutaceae bacterium]